MTLSRKDPCPCGSGKKYKHCCEYVAPRIDEDKLLRIERSKPGTISSMIAGLDAEIEARGGSPIK